MELWEIRAEIPEDAVEPADRVLLDCGVAEWVLLEDAVARRAWIVGIFRGESEARAQWLVLGPALPRVLGEPVARRLPDADWKNSFREHFKAWTFGRLHWVPVWEREAFRLPPGHSVLWLDPGMAFGTGNHETTRLCIERLVAFEAALSGGGGIRVVDAGCGSGILALSACLLGFQEVSGFDDDPEAIRVSRENAALNGLSDRVRFTRARLPDGLDGPPARVVLANIQADVLIRHARDLAGAVAAGGLLALSGILSAELDTVREAFAPATPGWTHGSTTLGEWSDLELRRPTG